MKLAIERRKTQIHSSQPSSSGAHEGTSVTPGVPNVPTYGSDDEQISWKSSDKEDDDDESNLGKDEDDDDQEDNDDQDNDNDQGDGDERIDSDNDGDDFVHPKFSTHDEEDKEEDRFHHRLQTRSHVESTDDEVSDEEIQGANVEGDKQDEEETNKEVEANELYRDVNINLEGQDIEMTNAQYTNVQPTQVTEDTHVIITTPVNPEDVLVTAIAESPLLSVTTTPPPPTPLIIHLQQTPAPTQATIPSSSIQDRNFGSLFGFDHRLKTLETNFSKFKQMNQFATSVSSIPGIIDLYLANRMNDAVKTAVQLQSERLREEAQAENQDFINKINDGMMEINKQQVKVHVKDQVSKILPQIKKLVNDQIEAEVLIHSSNESKTSHVVATNLSKLELKKILIDKMESNKHRDDEDKDKEPSAGSNRGSKRRRDGKEPESTNAPKEKTSKTTGKSTEGSKSYHKSAGESAQAEEPMHTAKDLEEPAH
ncbi:hypothetical protein Tco_0595566 [Tanacetum coccineum]